MKRAKVIIAVLILFLGFIACNDKNKEPKMPKAAKKIEVVSKVDFTLADIQKAHEILTRYDAGYYIKKEPRHSKQKIGKGKKARIKIRRWKIQKLDDFNVLLAVKSIKGIEVIKMKDKGKVAPKGFSVNFEKSNGVNTGFEVTYPEGYVVLALKRVVQVKKGRFKEAIYTPYTKSIDTPELCKVGMKYLRNNLEEAQLDLQNKKVRSKAYGGLVADNIPINVALVLSIIEHIDPSRFENTSVDQLINEVLVVVAANQKKAYSYSVSKAGARGLYQFIPSTYGNICRQYPKAKLQNDFVRGMNDHVNGAKASLLLFDSDLSYLDKQHRDFLKSNQKAMGKYLAAAYNGGSSRATKAINLYGNKWEIHVLKETVVYLQKFEAVWRIFYA